MSTRSSSARRLAVARALIAVVAVAVLPFVGASPAIAQSLWDGSVSSNWFDADNWTPVGVPGGPDNAIINTTPAVTASAPISVGLLGIASLSDPLPSATGSLTTTGAGITSSAIVVGANWGTVLGSSATGSLSVDGALTDPSAGFGSLTVGSGGWGNPTGSASGIVGVTGDVGPFGTLRVGASVGAGGLAGGSGTGSLTVGGSLVFRGALLVGEGINGTSATGTVSVPTGTISNSPGSSPAVLIGSTWTPDTSAAFVSSGSVTAQGIALSGVAVLAVGAVDASNLGASPGRSATGSLAATTGGIATLPGRTTSVGTIMATGNQGLVTAEGTLGIGGTLDGGGGASLLNVGFVSASGAGTTASSQGAVAAGGVTGFSAANVGRTIGSNASSVASGEVTVGSGGLSGTGLGASLNVGVASAGTATGTVRVTGGSISGIQYITLGAAESGTGTGTLEVTGGAVTLVGSSFMGVGGQPTAGGTTSGTLSVTDGGLTARILAIGPNFGSSGSATGSASFLRSAAVLDGGVPGSGGFVTVGGSFGGGTGTGTGSLSLTDSTMRVRDVLSVGSAGAPGASNGTLSLVRSLVDVGGSLWLTDGSLLQMALDGLLRGAQYGALDVGSAYLAGDLEILLNFAPGPGVSEFDLIVAGPFSGESFGSPGIFGTGCGADAESCFDAVSVLGLPSGFGWDLTLVPFGLGSDFEGAQILRLRIAEVPAPGALVLLALGAGALALRRRRP